MPDTKFDSKSFNPEAFGAYVRNVPNTKKTELAKSKAIGANEQAREALKNQTGALYVRVPYFGNIDGSTSQNNDGATDIKSTSTTTYEQGFVVASRMDGWTEKSFSKNITAGVDFMDHAGKQVANYKFEVKQDIILSILKGIYSMATTGNTVKAKAAADFISKHTFDITDKGDGMVTASTLNSATQAACGDNKEIFRLVFMHSSVATNLENLKLLKYLTYTDADGITRDLAIRTWNGRIVLVDDGMPTEDVAEVTDEEGNVTPAYTKYTTYALGEGSVILDDIGDAVPYEMYREPKVNGGQDTLYVRDRYICGVDGMSFEKPASLTASASNEDLANGANWAVINDGKNAISGKAIPITRIISKG